MFETNRQPQWRRELPTGAWPGLPFPPRKARATLSFGLPAGGAVSSGQPRRTLRRHAPPRRRRRRLRGASGAPPRRGLATARHGGVGRPPTRRADLIILRFLPRRAAGVMLRGPDLVQRVLLLRRVEHAPAQRQGAPRRAVRRLGHQDRRHVVRGRGRDQAGGGRWRPASVATQGPKHSLEFFLGPFAQGRFSRRGSRHDLP